MNDEERKQLAEAEGKSKEIGGKHTVGGFLSKTNYGGFQVPKEQEASAAQVVKEALKPQKKMYEPWKGAPAEDVHSRLCNVSQDH